MYMSRGTEKEQKLQLVFWFFFYNIVCWFAGLLFQTIRLIKFREKSTADNSRLSKFFHFLDLFIYSILLENFRLDGLSRCIERGKLCSRRIR